ncbi:MAG: MFS transporter [Planctomycetota bacterium]|jgi:MFS family permease
MCSDAQSVDGPGVLLSDRQRRRGLFFVGLAVGAIGFALVIQMASQANFVGEEMELSGLEQGLLEAIRESCGILALGALALLAGLAEPVLGAAVLVLFAVGLGAYNYVGSYTWLVVTSLVWSQGLHIWMPLPHSMTLAMAEPGRSGHRLGQIRAAAAVGSGVGLAIALALVWGGVSIRPLFLLAGAAALVAVAACLGVPREIRTIRPRIVFRRKYALYYLLSFLEGWRKQIFVAFAGFLLVKEHGTPLMTMLVLWMCIQLISCVASPLVGRLIDRVGERRVLVFYFLCLTVFFVGYAVIGNRRLLYGIYVIDSAFFVFAMALTTYVGRIAPPSEYTPTLSMGVAMNHVAAVTMPLAGGLLWKAVGHEWTFLIGAAGAALSIPAAMCMPRRQPPAQPEPSAPGAVASEAAMEHVEAE